MLTTPESAVRSYLDWTSYAYRIGSLASRRPTMTDPEEVRVDAYVQYNLQKNQVIDQTLTSITFGKASIGGTSTLRAGQGEVDLPLRLDRDGRQDCSVVRTPRAMTRPTPW